MWLLSGFTFGDSRRIRRRYFVEWLNASVGIKVSWMTYKTVFVSTPTKTKSHSDDPSRAGAGAGEMI